MVEFTDLDLLPDCSLENCGNGVHQHILDQQKEALDFITDLTDPRKRYLFMQGGVGSGKSIIAASAVCKLSLSISCNRGVVGRRDFKLLYESIWRDVRSCLRRLIGRGIIETPQNFNRKSWDKDSIKLIENDSELRAVQTKNLSEALGTGYGWFLIDDAMECHEDFFVGNDVTAGLLSRLRNFVRDYTDNTPLRLRGIVISNPPPIGHWLHKLFGRDEGEYEIGGDLVKVMRLETLQNPFVGETYATGILATQKRMGRGIDVISRVLYGKSTPAYGGIPVFPQFDHGRHIGEWEFNPDNPLTRNWDFGFHHPACIFAELWRCVEGYNHYRALSEVADQFSMFVGEFWEVVRNHTIENYKGATIFDSGDRAGWRRSDSNKDKRGPMRILVEEHGLNFKHRYLDLDNSLDYMRSLLKHTCDCGEEIIQVDKRCEILIGGLEGGYKYTKNRQGIISEKPFEDKFFADPCCAWRYGAENFVKFGVLYTYKDMPTKRYRKTPRPWDWMNMNDSELGELLTTDTD